MKTFPRYLSLPILLGMCLVARAADLSYNTGTLGTLGDGTNAVGFGTVDVTLNQPGALAAYDDFSSGYTGGNYTTVPYRPELNPASNSPFTIEFWARPTTSTNNNAPVSCRVSAGNRSGWAFFQRAAATGWNFVMYNGSASARGWDLTGGTATLNAWSHVVATWSGSAATLYVNGAQISASNAGNGTVGYNASTTAVFSVGNLFDSNSAFNGALDEIAFYPTALTLTQISQHYSASSSPTPGAYRTLVQSHGAVEYLQQNPPFIKLAQSGPNAVLTWTGILAQSADLSAGSWVDLSVTSPYTITPALAAPKLFFRAHR